MSTFFPVNWGELEHNTWHESSCVPVDFYTIKVHENIHNVESVSFAKYNILLRWEAVQRDNQAKISSKIKQMVQTLLKNIHPIKN